MNTLLHRDLQDWQRIGGADTAEEIAQQAQLWRALAQSLAGEKAGISAFLGTWLNEAGNRVILTGAGSSAFVGEIAVDEINSAWPAQVRCVATTSLLTHPELYLDDAPTLLVSFARSGNSPESLAAVDLLRQRLKAPRFLNITCNAQGRLALQAQGRADSLNLLMPPASCDRGFAMTSSFSCMLIAALCVLGGQHDAPRRITALADRAEAALQAWAQPIAKLACEPFERIIYLGSGPLEALAKEGALKVLELSAGRALAMANTPLGFRHGPKSALNRASLVLMLRSAKPVVQRYEQDLIDELRRDGIARCLSIGPAATGADLNAVAPEGMSDAWLAPLWLLGAQLFSLNKSAALGLTPDNPFPDGTVNRVVQGVTIHEH
ncbi:MAG: SIS domain-containing protein [Paucibacter sp.]|nr:SIS domain-containing protein [Roseateles sp.]